MIRPILNKRVMVKKETPEDEKELNAVVKNIKDEVKIGRHTWKIGYLHYGTKRKITDILVSEKEEDKVTAKCAAALALNGCFKIALFHWFLWRWFYYIKEYTDKDYLDIISLCKKKVGVEDYCVAIIYLTEMKDTIKMMTRKEVNLIRQENFGAQRGS